MQLSPEAAEIVSSLVEDPTVQELLDRLAPKLQSSRDRLANAENGREDAVRAASEKADAEIAELRAETGRYEQAQKELEEALAEPQA